MNNREYTELIPLLELIKEKLNALANSQGAGTEIEEVKYEASKPGTLTFVTCSGEDVTAEVEFGYQVIFFRMKDLTISLPLEDILGRPN